MGAVPARWHNGAAAMGRADGTDPALVNTPVPLEGDGRELVGMIIDGSYRLDATLGRGGMGLVYRAAHVGLRRLVAVKILHPSLATSSGVRNRLEREALAVGKIDHPNCVTVYDVGRLPDGSLYLAMELLEGRPLGGGVEAGGAAPAGGRAGAGGAAAAGARAAHSGGHPARARAYSSREADPPRHQAGEHLP